MSNIFNNNQYQPQQYEEELPEYNDDISQDPYAEYQEEYQEYYYEDEQPQQYYEEYAPPQPRHAPRQRFMEDRPRTDNFVVPYKTATDADMAAIDQGRVRLEMCRLYEILLEKNIFEGIEANEAALEKVESDFKDFVLDRFQVLMGLKAPKSETPERIEVKVISPFNDIEASFLKNLAFQGTKSASAKGKKVILTNDIVKSQAAVTAKPLVPAAPQQATLRKPVPQPQPRPQAPRPRPVQPQAPQPVQQPAPQSRGQLPRPVPPQRPPQQQMQRPQPRPQAPRPQQRQEAPQQYPKQVPQRRPQPLQQRQPIRPPNPNELNVRIISDLAGNYSPQTIEAIAREELRIEQMRMQGLIEDVARDYRPRAAPTTALAMPDTNTILSLRNRQVDVNLGNLNRASSGKNFNISHGVHDAGED